MSSYSSPKECSRCCCPEYVHLDSANRDRSRYPLSTEFAADLRATADGQVASYATRNFRDPSIRGLPVLVGDVQSGNTDTIVLPPGVAPDTDGALEGCTFESHRGTAIIIDYVASTRTITLGSALSGVHAAGDSFIIDSPGEGSPHADNAMITGTVANSELATATTVELSNVVGIVANSTIFFSGIEPRTVSSISGNTVTITPALTAVLSAETPYYVRVPDGRATIGLAQAGTTTTVQLAAGSISTDDFYNNAYVMIIERTIPQAGAATDVHTEIRRITDYDGSTLTATVSPAFGSAPAANDEYRIFFADEQYSDVLNAQSLYAQIKQMNRCMYRMNLKFLSIPNEPVLVPPSMYEGRSEIPAWQLPYIVMRVEPIGGSCSAGVASNNFNSRGAAFVIGFDNISEPTQRHLYLNEGNLDQCVELHGWQRFKVSLHIPSGEPLQYSKPDNPSPYPPNAFLQTSAMIEFCLMGCPPSHKDLPNASACSTCRSTSGQHSRMTAEAFGKVSQCGPTEYIGANIPSALRGQRR